MRNILLLALAVIALSAGVTAAQFGHDMLKHFMLDQSYVNLNHGSYGSVPRVVFDDNVRCLAEGMFFCVSLSNHRLSLVIPVESSPDKWFRYTYRSIYNASRIELAEFVHQPGNYTSVVITDNASSAVNALLRSIKFNRDDSVLVFETAYPMVKNTLKYLGVKVLTIPVTLPILSVQSFLKGLEDWLSINCRSQQCTYAMIDHVSSVPSIAYPLREIGLLFKVYNISLMVDGAHTLGNIPLDLESIPNLVAYLTNAHKWMFSSKTACMLWFDQKFAQSIDLTPVVVSSDYHFGEPTYNFFYVGTKDYCPYMSVKKALEFRRSIGTEQQIMKYNSDLAWNAKNRVCQMWESAFAPWKCGTDLAPQAMTSALINMPFPFNDTAKAVAIQSAVYTKYNLFFVVFEYQRKPYVRLSAQIYNDITDYEKMAQYVITESKNF